MRAAQPSWLLTPAPRRGEIVRQIGERLRKHRVALGALISLEMGKIASEGVGEVQEFIDMCDLAAGMARQLPGQVLPSEREEHLLLEYWHVMSEITSD
jgi:aldehyde dehydrogenase family 7 protein A1